MFDEDIMEQRRVTAIYLSLFLAWAIGSLGTLFSLAVDIPFVLGTGINITSWILAYYLGRQIIENYRWYEVDNISMWNTKSDGDEEKVWYITIGGPDPMDPTLIINKPIESLKEGDKVRAHFGGERYRLEVINNHKFNTIDCRHIEFFILKRRRG